MPVGERLIRRRGGQRRDEQQDAEVRVRGADRGARRRDAGEHRGADAALAAPGR